MVKFNFVTYRDIIVKDSVAIKTPTYPILIPLPSLMYQAISNLLYITVASMMLLSLTMVACATAMTVNMQPWRSPGGACHQGTHYPCDGGLDCIPCPGQDMPGGTGVVSIKY